MGVDAVSLFRELPTCLWTLITVVCFSKLIWNNFLILFYQLTVGFLQTTSSKLKLGESKAESNEHSWRLATFYFCTFVVSCSERNAILLYLWFVFIDFQLVYKVKIR